MSLFKTLMELVESNEAFFFKDFIHSDGYTYRIFNYRLAGWEMFQTLEGAKECRGVMFREEPNETWVLVSRPMEKFFNAHEGAVEHDWSSPKAVMVKEDGSLISTFLDANGNLGVKSKGSLSSSQAIDAYEYLSKNPKFSLELERIAKDAFTVNMEYVAPHNRIVLPYEKPELRVLNIRCNSTGAYQKLHTVKSYWPEVYSRLTGYLDIVNVEEFVASVPAMKGIEGFVIQKNNGEHVKLKTDEYIVLHHSKDSINNPKALYMTVIEEATDDLREMFIDDQITLNLISKMEQEVAKRYNHAADLVTKFYEKNCALDRKDYAIKGQKELESWLFSVAMRMYLDGNDAYLKPAVQKQWKVWGNEIKDIVYGKDYGEEI